MIARDKIEEYLQSEMLRLCSSRHDDSNARDGIAAVAPLFSFDAMFSDVAAALGPAKSSALWVGQSPPSLRDSVEHRFHFALWPDFEFVVCASPAGHAWGQRFVRASHAQTPVIARLSDLGRWSHTLPEVSATLGQPIEAEGWSTWESATFRLKEDTVRLCFVFELLQSVTRVE